MDVVSEIKSRLEIVDVVKDYVPNLKKTGRYYKALSPFQKEKTPSFVVNPERGLAYCFSTNRGGDIFKFIQEVEGVDFPEALKILADKAGVKLTDSHFKTGGAISHKSELYSIYEEANKIYTNLLWSEEGKEGLEYLKKRGLNDEIIKSFKLGYAPEGNVLLNKMKDKSNFEFTKTKSGLFNISDSGEVYDKFRGRVMFPITNSQGLTIAFTARTIGNATPKYVNSPELPIFNKGSILYGYKNARDEIRNKNFIIVVEGQMDVLMSHQAGAKNVVASSGTAFTQNQVQLIKRLTSNIAFSLDQDTAGIQAAYKAVALCLQNDMNIKMINIDKKDPGDLIAEDSSKWLDAIKDSRYFIDYFINLYKKNVDPNNNSLRKEFMNKMFSMIINCQSAIELSDLFKKLSVGLRISEDLIRSDFSKFKNKELKQKEESIDNDVISWTDEDIIRTFIKKFPIIKKHSEKYLNDLKIMGIINVYNSSDDVYNSLEEQKVNTKENLDQGNDNLIGLEMLTEDYYGEMDDKELCDEFDRLISKVKIIYKKKRVSEISMEMKVAEESEDMDKLNELQIELMNITNFNG